MQIKITFRYTNSKFYVATSDLCKKIGKFFQEGDKKSTIQNTFIVNYDELRKSRRTFNQILFYLSKWKNVEYFINDEIVGIRDIRDLQKLITCEIDGTSQVVDPTEFCCSGNGWGCRLLTSINLCSGDAIYFNTNTSNYTGTHPWFDYGSFKNNIWEINKENILSQLEQEISDKEIKLCKHYNFERIKKAIDALPNSIEVTDEKECPWEYKCRDTPMGVDQKEIIGIQKRRSAYSHTFSLSLNTFGDEGTNNIAKNIPNVSFNDIGGIRDIIQEVREVIELPLKAPEFIEHYHIKPHKGILLCGPPGCGKTLIAKAIAHEIDAHFIVVNGPEIINKWMGQSEENIRNIFDEAKKQSPTIIFFDEFDAISPSRDNEQNPHMTGIVNQLLTEMDGVMEMGKVCAIASTNRPDIIDPALKRPGRFDYILEIKLPSLEGCKEIFNIHTKNMPVDSSFNKDRFAEKYLCGLSGADIAFIANEAAYNSIRRTVNTKDLFSDLSETKPSKINIIKEEDFVLALSKLQNR